MDEPIRHGGNLERARQMFPQAPQPFVDLSTGINPHSYPYSPLPASAFARLPDPGDLERLKAVAAETFGAASPAHLVAAPGTQMLLPLLADAARKEGAKSAAVLSPAYAEHARAARMAGLEVREVSQFDALSQADLAVVINPNNPDGRVHSCADLLALADQMRSKGGLLVVDEAFIETGFAESMASRAGHPRENLVVLRSFGKFYGLAGVRLGFALGAPERVAAIEARLGPWAVSGPALHVAREALADENWRADMRARLKGEMMRLDARLSAAGLEIIGGTSLFRLVRSDRAGEIFQALGEAGILVRAFDERPRDLRFGLPGQEEDWVRLAAALESFS